MTEFTRISQLVGWTAPNIQTFPTLAQVESAIEAGDCRRILTWHRFLRSGRTPEEHATIYRISEAFVVMRTLLDRGMCGGGTGSGTGVPPVSDNPTEAHP